MDHIRDNFWETVLSYYEGAGNQIQVSRLGSKCLSCWVISLTWCTHFLKRTWRVPDTKISYLILNSQLLSRMTWNGGEKEKFYKTESMAAFCILVVLNFSVTEPFKNLLNKWIDKMCLQARNFIQSYRKNKIMTSAGKWTEMESEITQLQKKIPQISLRF